MYNKGFILSILVFLFGCKSESSVIGVYISNPNNLDLAKYKHLLDYSIVGNDSLILKENGEYDYYAKCGNRYFQGNWIIQNDSILLDGNHTYIDPTVFEVKSKGKLYGKIKTDSVKLLRVYSKVE